MPLSSTPSEITVGSQVCLRKAPMYQAGSIGFTVAGGVPKVGQLLNAAWNITDNCRFRIMQPPKRPKLPELPKEKEKQKEEYDSASMPPPPSPASSTCSDGSLSAPPAPVAGAGQRRQKRSAPREEPEKVDEEEWSLKEVIFVEDSRNVPIGRVLKVDGQHTLVHFPPLSEKTNQAMASSGPPQRPTTPTPPPPSAMGSQTPKKEQQVQRIFYPRALRLCRGTFLLCSGVHFYFVPARGRVHFVCTRAGPSTYLVCTRVHF